MISQLIDSLFKCLSKVLVEFIYSAPEFLVSLANNNLPAGDIFENADIYFAIRLKSSEVLIMPLMPEILLIKVILVA